MKSKVTTYIHITILALKDTDKPDTLYKSMNFLGEKSELQLSIEEEKSAGNS